MALTLYSDSFFTSPYVFSAFVALREKQQRFELVPIALKDGAQREPAYRDRSLTAKVPALDHDGFWLSESAAIVEYADEAFPGGVRLLPSGLRERARARQVMGWLRTDLAPLREARPSSTLFYSRPIAPLGAEAQKAAEKLVRVASTLVAPGTTALFGEFSVADAELAFTLQRLVHNGDPVPDALRQFANTLWQRPSVRAFVELARPPYEAY